MRFRHPHLHAGMIFAIFILLITIGVPESAAANAGSMTGYKLFQGMVTRPGLISAREAGIDLTSSAEDWTLNRMESALPYPLPDIDQLPRVPVNLNDANIEPVYLPSVPPLAGTESGSSGDDPALLNELSITGYEYPAPFTRFENFDSYQAFP